MTFTDFLGKTINVGDTIVYPGRQGSSLWLNKGIVRQVVDTEGNGGPYLGLQVERIAQPGRPWEKDGTMVTITALERVVVVS